ncbi:LysE family transporter [Bradymonas sediminis]|uniref:Uncharacterized protein n=1 Tax=Bradymonas sediminis TaxID=1548548 RepID=A0A2Z4FL69_9DELT|nr:LysE family transporter [Bradymonas sediminis]AWV89448.1 hypothetical protein DN745_08895 [Bradymonas sediminis]TDP76826.1 LysE type translocator [Bradymonas sediminis]
MGDVFWVILVGFGMGFIGSIPPLGPVALMMINRVFKGQLKFAFFTGVGGAVAEVIYAALAVTGVGLLHSKAGVTSELLALISASILLGVGLYFFYQSYKKHPAPAHPNLAEQGDPELAADASTGTSFSHFMRGFSVSFLNPILIINWTLAVAYFFSLFQLKADLVGQLLFAVAVGAGKILWTAIEVILLNLFRERYSRAVLARVEKGLSVALIVSALFLGYQTLFLA